MYEVEINDNIIDERIYWFILILSRDRERERERERLKKIIGI
jgi:hypothetical protein